MHYSVFKTRLRQLLKKSFYKLKRLTVFDLFTRHRKVLSLLKVTPINAIIINTVKYPANLNNYQKYTSRSLLIGGRYIYTFYN